jgi:hypothetical protein
LKSKREKPFGASFFSLTAHTEQTTVDCTAPGNMVNEYAPGGGHATGSPSSGPGRR